MSVPLIRESVRILRMTDPAEKSQATSDLADAWRRGAATIDRDCAEAAPDEPGRPARPELVPPARLPRRGVQNPGGRAAMLHAIAHIEFTAIQLALDACARFRDLPDAWYGDWLMVAADEASHFQLLEQALQTRGFAYGSFTAHGGLWEAAHRTRHDPLARMALVPRTHEARGLDATPSIRARFAAVQDTPAVAILDRILRDEIGHVAAGDRWFAWLCERRGQAPASTYKALCRRYGAPPPHRPLNRAARLAAGFGPEELDDIEQWNAQPDKESGRPG